MPYKNLWIDGFQNYEEFNTIFKTAQTKISELKKEDIIKIWKYNKLSVNAQNEIYLNNLPKFNYDLEKYIDFINSQLVAKKASKRNFILHAVMPNCTSFGIILDDTYKNLYFAKILNDKTSLYLIGDSSAAYPPGYSMEIGMLTIFKFMPIFLKKLFPEKINDDIPIYIDSKLEIGNGILENPDLINEVCNSINTLEFKGGFIKDKDSENTKSKNIKEIIRIINTKEKLKNILIDTYNEIQLNTFILSLIKINCNDIN